jgi:hypothetical protein
MPFGSVYLAQRQPFPLYELDATEDLFVFLCNIFPNLIGEYCPGRGDMHSLRLSLR